MEKEARDIRNAEGKILCEKPSETDDLLRGLEKGALGEKENLEKVDSRKRGEG